MTRTRTTAKAAGTRFERLVADYLAAHVDPRIERRARTGAKDRGDISGLRHMGGRLVIECKDVTRWTPAEWLAEAEVERGNDDALAGLVVAKRRGKADPAAQLVMCTLADFVALLTGTRPGEPAAADPTTTPGQRADAHRCESATELTAVLRAASNTPALRGTPADLIEPAPDRADDQRWSLAYCGSLRGGRPTHDPDGVTS